ncbi:MAG: hypothetical protein AB1Y26_07465 [Cycloclasticus sp.]
MASNSTDIIEALDRLHETQHSYAAIRDLLNQAANSSNHESCLDSVGTNNLLNLFCLVYDSMEEAITKLDDAHRLGNFRVVS